MDDVRKELSTDTLDKYHAAALEFAGEMRQVIEGVTKSGLGVEQKGDKSLVTKADIAAEKAFRAGVAERFPECGVIGEEFPASNPDSPLQWIVDPVDGTEEFARGMPTWGTIIALHYQGEPIVGVLDHPKLGMLISARYGGGCFYNGERIQMTDVSRLESDAGRRIAMTARANFRKYGECEDVYVNLTDRYPNHRILRTCFAHAAAIVGMVDVMVEYNVRLWDVAASRILAEEAGGAYLEKKKVIAGVGDVYCSVFGLKEVVDEVAELVFSG